MKTSEHGEPRSSEDTLNRIVEAALATFSEVEFQKATMREIARKAGVGLGTIYSYFPSKEQVLQQILEEKTREGIAALWEHLQGIEGTFDRIRKHTWFIFHFLECNPRVAALTYLALPFHVLLRYDPAHEIARKHARIFMDIIEEGKVAGDVRDNIDVRRVRDLYFGGLQRLATAWLLSGRSYSLVGMARDFSELIIHSMRTVPEMRGSTKSGGSEETP